MYNGIGLPTPRGSGTNGYIQRNLAHVPVKRQEEYNPPDPKSQAIFKKPNKDILEHERKRKIELKCVELEDLMEKQGYSHEDIEAKVNVYRQSLIDKHNEQMKIDSEIKVDEFEKDMGGRIVGKGTHETAIANSLKDQKFKNALNIKGGDNKDVNDVFDKQVKSKSKRKHDELKKDDESDEDKPKKKKSKKSKKKKRESEALSIDGSDSEYEEKMEKKRKHKKKLKKQKKKDKNKKSKKKHDSDNDSKESGQISESLSSKHNSKEKLETEKNEKHEKSKDNIQELTKRCERNDRSSREFNVDKRDRLKDFNGSEKVVIQNLRRENDNRRRFDNNDRSVGKISETRRETRRPETYRDYDFNKPERASSIERLRRSKELSREEYRRDRSDSNREYRIESKGMYRRKSINENENRKDFKECSDKHCGKELKEIENDRRRVSKDKASIKEPSRENYKSKKETEGIPKRSSPEADFSVSKEAKEKQRIDSYDSKINIKEDKKDDRNYRKTKQSNERESLRSSYRKDEDDSRNYKGKGDFEHRDKRTKSYNEKESDQYLKYKEKAKEYRDTYNRPKVIDSNSDRDKKRNLEETNSLASSYDEKKISAKTDEDRKTGEKRKMNENIEHTSIKRPQLSKNCGQIETVSSHKRQINSSQDSSSDSSVSSSSSSESSSSSDESQ